MRTKMNKEYRIQIRREVYETYTINVNGTEDEEEAMEKAIAKLDNVNGLTTSEIQLTDTFTEFGGFLSIESKNIDGRYTKILGQRIEQ